MKKITIIVISIGVLGIAWYLLSPLFINQNIDETSPLSQKQQNQSEIQIESENTTAPEEDINIVEMEDTVMDEPMIEMATTVSTETRGSFAGADNFHKGSGSLKVIKDGNQTFLRFEDFSVTNGPDLFVTLNKQSNPSSNNFGEHVIVRALKGNQGDQNYDVSEYDLGEYQSVSIYCKNFTTVFATASL